MAKQRNKSGNIKKKSMEKRLVICDTNIFIEFYKNNEQIVQNLKKIRLEKSYFLINPSQIIVDGFLFFKL